MVRLTDRLDINFDVSVDVKQKYNNNNTKCDGRNRTSAKLYILKIGGYFGFSDVWRDIIKHLCRYMLKNIFMTHLGIRTHDLGNTP